VIQSLAREKRFTVHCTQFWQVINEIVVQKS